MQGDDMKNEFIQMNVNKYVKKRWYLMFISICICALAFTLLDQIYLFPFSISSAHLLNQKEISKKEEEKKHGININEEELNSRNVVSLIPSNFFTQIQTTFIEIIQPSTTDTVRVEKLSAINAFGLSGVKVIIDELNKKNWTESEVQQNLALVD